MVFVKHGPLVPGQSALVSSQEVVGTFLHTPVAMAWRVLPTKSLSEIDDPKKCPLVEGSIPGITARTRPKRFSMSALLLTVVDSSDWLFSRMPASEARRTVFCRMVACGAGMATYMPISTLPLLPSTVLPTTRGSVAPIQMLVKVLAPMQVPLLTVSPQAAAVRKQSALVPQARSESRLQVPATPNASPGARPLKWSAWCAPTMVFPVMIGRTAPAAVAMPKGSEVRPKSTKFPSTTLSSWRADDPGVRASSRPGIWMTSPSMQKL